MPDLRGLLLAGNIAARGPLSFRSMPPMRRPMVVARSNPAITASIRTSTRPRRPPQRPARPTASSRRVSGSAVSRGRCWRARDRQPACRGHRLGGGAVAQPPSRLGSQGAARHPPPRRPPSSRNCFSVSRFAATARLTREVASGATSVSRPEDPRSTALVSRVPPPVTSSR